MGLNILFYYPRRLFRRRWLYGADLIEQVATIYKGEVKIIVATNITDALNSLHWVDLFINCNKAIKQNPVVRRCMEREIPVYHSICDPDIKEIVNKVDKVMNKFCILQND